MYDEGLDEVYADDQVSFVVESWSHAYNMCNHGKEELFDPVFLEVDKIIGMRKVGHFD